MSAASYVRADCIGLDLPLCECAHEAWDHMEYPGRGGERAEAPGAPMCGPCYGRDEGDIHERWAHVYTPASASEPAGGEREGGISR